MPLVSRAIDTASDTAAVDSRYAWSLSHCDGCSIFGDGGSLTGPPGAWPSVQVGNAVPPPVARVLMTAVRDALA